MPPCSQSGLRRIHRGGNGAAGERRSHLKRMKTTMKTRHLCLFNLLSGIIWCFCLVQFSVSSAEPGQIVSHRRFYIQSTATFNGQRTGSKVPVFQTSELPPTSQPQWMKTNNMAFHSYISRQCQGGHLYLLWLVNYELNVFPSLIWVDCAVQTTSWL